MARPNNAKARLQYLFDSTGTDVSDDVSNFTIEAAEADGAFLSYAAAREGGQQVYTARFTIPQDFSTGSLWSTMATEKGNTWTGYVTFGIDDLDDTTTGSAVWEFNAIVSIPNGVVLGAETTTSSAAVPTVELEWELVDFDLVTSRQTTAPIA